MSGEKIDYFFWTNHVDCRLSKRWGKISHKELISLSVTCQMVPLPTLTEVLIVPRSIRDLRLRAVAVDKDKGLLVSKVKKSPRWDQVNFLSVSRSKWNGRLIDAWQKCDNLLCEIFAPRLRFHQYAGSQSRVSLLPILLASLPFLTPLWRPPLLLPRASKIDEMAALSLDTEVEW